MTDQVRMNVVLRANAEEYIDIAYRGYQLAGRGALWWWSPTEVKYVGLEAKPNWDKETIEQVETYDPVFHFVFAYPSESHGTLVMTVSIEELLKSVPARRN